MLEREAQLNEQVQALVDAIRAGNGHAVTVLTDAMANSSRHLGAIYDFVRDGLIDFAEVQATISAVDNIAGAFIRLLEVFGKED